MTLGSWEIDVTSDDPLWSVGLKDATYNLETAYPNSLLGLRLIREGVQIDIYELRDGTVRVEVEAFDDRGAKRSISSEPAGLGKSLRVSVEEEKK